MNLSGRFFMEIIYNEKICVKCGACASESECGGILLERGKIILDETRKEDWASIAEICPTGALKIIFSSSRP